MFFFSFFNLNLCHLWTSTCDAFSHCIFLRNFNLTYFCSVWPTKNSSVKIKKKIVIDENRTKTNDLIINFFFCRHQQSAVSHDGFIFFNFPNKLYTLWCRKMCKCSVHVLKNIVFNLNWFFYFYFKVCFSQPIFGLIW